MKTARNYRIGEKLVSLDKALGLIEKALELREQGFSQQETANKLQLDRSFVSRLESIGELRKGGRIAVVGFPLANRDQLADICRAQGLDFYLLMSNEERWAMVRDQQALDFFNRMFDLVTRLRAFDTLIMITSEKWYRLAEALIDTQVVYIELGPTPIEDDCYLEPAMLEETIQQVMCG